MKNKKIFIISIIISIFIFTLICKSNPKITMVKDDYITGNYLDSNSDSIFINSFLSSYFYNLNNNKGNNTNGTCGYIALAMALSFYDTYFDDDIINDRFDANALISLSCLNLSLIDESPGIRNENYILGSHNTPSTRLSDGDLLDLILYGSDEEGNNYYDIYFQYYLIRLSRVLRINGSYGITNSNLWNLICYYINNECDSLSAICIDMLYEYNIKMYIDMGYPVIVALNNGNLLDYHGHFVVAYDYDAETGTIYANYGYLNQKNHYALNADIYNMIDGAFVIYPKEGYQHNHSNNYVNLSSNLTYCSCQFNEHELHSHNYSDVYYDENFHELICICGESILEEHNYSYLNNSHTEHLVYCNCGYSYTTSHNFRLKYSKGVQYRYCLNCGYQYVYKGLDLYNNIQELLGE